MSHVTAGDAALVGESGAAAEEFRVFYAAQFTAVAGYAFKLTQDEELARDLTQEAFTRLLSRWVRVREPRAYLFHTVTNLVRDAWRAGRRQAEAMTALAPAGAVDGPDGAVADAVSRLPAGHRRPEPERRSVRVHERRSLRGLGPSHVAGRIPVVMATRIFPATCGGGWTGAAARCLHGPSERKDGP